jgi:hypothetical protein
MSKIRLIRGVYKKNKKVFNSFKVNIFKSEDQKKENESFLFFLKI